MKPLVFISIKYCQFTKFQCYFYYFELNKKESRSICDYAQRASFKDRDTIFFIVWISWKLEELRMCVVHWMNMQRLLSFTHIFIAFFAVTKYIAVQLQFWKRKSFNKRALLLCRSQVKTQKLLACAKLASSKKYCRKFWTRLYLATFLCVPTLYFDPRFIGMFYGFQNHLQHNSRRLSSIL